MNATILVALATTHLLSALAPDDAKSREDNMFGGEDAPAAATPPVAATAGASRDDAIFGGDANASSATAPPAAKPENPDIMAGEEKALTLGGQLFLRLNDAYAEGNSIGDTTLSSPSLADVFADVRPNDRLRGFAQLRVDYDFTITDGTKNLFGQTQNQFQLQLDQLWLKFDIGHVAYVTAGRQHIRWGTGRFWNPTDFVNTEVRNSVDFFDTRLGVNIIKVHFPFEALGWNLYLIGLMDGVDVLNKSGIAARAEFVEGPAELALSSLVKKGSPLRFGVDASAGVWLLDLRAEATVQRGLDTKQFTGAPDYDKGIPPLYGATQVTGTDTNWYVRGVVGGDITLKYTDDDSIILGGEYFYNEAGYDSAKLYPVLALNGAFVPFYLGKHYFGAYATAAAPFQFNNTNVTLSTLGNISDGSYLSRLDVQQLALTNLTVNVFGDVHWGNTGEFKLGVNLPAIKNPLTGATLFPGIDIRSPLFDVGVALRVAL